MPIEFQTSLSLDLVYTRWWGDVTMDDFRATFARYQTDAHYRPGRTELCDFTDVESADATFASIWSALNMVNGQLPGHTVRTRTLMVTPDEKIFGLARIYQTLADNAKGITVELFRDRVDALAALNLRQTTIDAMLEAGAFIPYTPASRTTYGS